MNGTGWTGIGVAIAVLAIAGGAGAKDDGIVQPGHEAREPASKVEKAAKKWSPAERREIERGEYLVRVAGCGDCHTPLRFDEAVGHPVPMMERLLSGHPEGAPAPVSALSAPDLGVIGPSFTSFRLPFGVVYAANLTPDVETGIGGWKRADFVKAMQTGRHMGQGRAILPPMPWSNLTAAAPKDLEAMFAYLQSLPPVKNRVPDNQVPPAVYEQHEQANRDIVQTIYRAKKK
jgi:hypothetical protein